MGIFRELELFFRLLKYKGRYKRAREALGFIPDIRSTGETLRRLNEGACSISRFGDGEFNLLRGRGNGFCRYHAGLAERLREVLTVPVEGHVVGIPRALVCQENLNLRTRVFWLAYFTRAFEVLKRYLVPGRVYYDASFSRFYIAYKNRSVCAGYVEGIRRIWEGRDVLVVEGEYSRLGVGNDLFGNVRSLRRVLAPAVDAFERYGEILAAAKRHGEGRLVLLALGQTATVLAYDLAKAGFWAIDIGHVDLEYEWFLRGLRWKERIPGKFVNEVKGGAAVPEGEVDGEYLAQVVERVV